MHVVIKHGSHVLISQDYLHCRPDLAADENHIYPYAMLVEVNVFVFVCFYNFLERSHIDYLPKELPNYLLI